MRGVMPHIHELRNNHHSSVESYHCGQHIIKIKIEALSYIFWNICRGSTLYSVTCAHNSVVYFYCMCYLAKQQAITSSTRGTY